MKASLQHCHLLEPDQCDRALGTAEWRQWSLGDAHVLRGPHERPASHLLWVSVGEAVSHPQVLLSHSLWESCGFCLSLRGSCVSRVLASMAACVRPSWAWVQDPVPAWWTAEL